MSIFPIFVSWNQLSRFDTPDDTPPQVANLATAARNSQGLVPEIPESNKSSLSKKSFIRFACVPCMPAVDTCAASLTCRGSLNCQACQGCALGSRVRQNWSISFFSRCSAPLKARLTALKQLSSSRVRSVAIRDAETTGRGGNGPCVGLA